MSSDIEHEPWRTVEYGNLALVRAVKKRPCLYNNTLPEYSQKDVTRAAWEEIAEEFGCSVAELKKKWKGLRTVYTRETSLVRAKKKQKPYYLAKHMGYLRPFLKHQPASAYKTVIEALRKSYDYSLEVPFSNSSVEDEEISEPMNSMETSDEISNDADTSNDAVNDVETASNNSDDIVASAMTVLQNSESDVNRSDSACQRTDIVATAMTVLQNSESDVNQSDSPCKRTVQPVIIQCIKASEDFAVNNYSQNNAENPRIQFVSSLLPEVEEMTEKQFRNFKRKVFKMIDDVLLDS